MATVGRALGFPGLAAFAVGPGATPPTEGWLRAVALDMPLLLTLEALLRLEHSLVGLTV